MTNEVWQNQCRSKQMTVDGVEIAYLDRGKGPVVIIAHCSSASHKEWLPLIETLEPDWRVLAPDFIGYGQSGAWPEGKVFTGKADLAVLLELAKKTKKHVHLVGHSYGAAMALEAARELGPKVQSLTLVEPVSFNLLRVEGRPEWTEIEKLGVPCSPPCRTARTARRQAAFMRYWLGRLRWWLSPEKFKAAITATIHKVALEFMIAHRGRQEAQRLCERDRAHLADRRRQNSRADPRRGRHARRDLAQCGRHGDQGRWPYEPVHPSFRGKPDDRRPSRRSAPMNAGSSSASLSSSTSRANSSSSSYRRVWALARTFSRSV